MSFDPVPLAIGGGAVHTDDLWRVAANAFSSDSQGIILPGQMKVTALGTPGEAVTVATGGVIVRNAQKAGESYVGRAATTTQVSTPRNNSGSVVRHLLIARIIDPDYSPWQPSGTPGQPNVSVPDGPYFEPFLVSGVAAGVTRASQVVSYSAVALARLDVASVGSGASPVTTAMITDCRELARARTGFAYDVQSAGSQQNILISNTTMFQWPNNSLNVYVPRWATHAQVDVTVLPVWSTGPANFNWRVNLAGTAGPTTQFDTNATGGTAQSHSAYGEFVVTAVQDSTVVLKTEAQRISVQNTGGLFVSSTSLIKYNVMFSERVI